MSMNRIVALLICIMLTFGCLASCQPTEDHDKLPDNPSVDETPEDETPENPEDELPTDQYVMTSNIIFASNDSKMVSLITAMNSSLQLTVDKDNLYLCHTSSVNQLNLLREYTVYDGMLYHSTNIQNDKISASEYEKAIMDAQNIDELLNKVGAGAQIDATDFNNPGMSTSGDRTSYVCKDMKEDAKASLLSVFSSAFEGENAIVVLDSVEYRLTMKGERNQESTLSCNFTIIMNGNNYQITMHVMSSYNYTKDAIVSAPEGVDKYDEVRYEDIIG